MNAPPPDDACIVPEGIERFAYAPDTKVADAGTFTLQREDETLGNLLRMKLLTNPDVLFAGYIHPHPLENVILLKIRTVPASSPAKALELAIKLLVHQVEASITTFDNVTNRFEQARQDDMMGE